MYLCMNRKKNLKSIIKKLNQPPGLNGINETRENSDETKSFYRKMT